MKLVDAGFIWTEPHSRRLKVKVTIQAEVFNGAILQQSFVVEFIVETHMCPDCEKQNANPNTWVAAVQVGSTEFSQLRHHAAPCLPLMTCSWLIVVTSLSRGGLQARLINRALKIMSAVKAHHLNAQCIGMNSASYCPNAAMKQSKTNAKLLICRFVSTQSISGHFFIWSS